MATATLTSMRSVGRSAVGGCSSWAPSATRAFASSARTGKPFTLRPGSARKADGERAGTSAASTSAGGMLRMIMFGKPGAGKGTLSARLVKKYDILSLSTGDLLRQHIAERTEVGRMAEEIVAHGGLLPDELMLEVITSKLDALHNRHWILDGFPRTVGQGEMLDAHLRTKGTPLSLVVNLDVPDAVILSRIADRWVHLPSGRVYNLAYNPPRTPGRDDATGEPLAKRPDDNPETFARRLRQFYASTSPLLQYYAAPSAAAVGAGVPVGAQLVSLAGSSSDEIWPQLEAAVRRACPKLLELDPTPPTRDEKRKQALAEVSAAHALSEDSKERGSKDDRRLP